MDKHRLYRICGEAAVSNIVRSNCKLSIFTFWQSRALGRHSRLLAITTFVALSSGCTSLGDYIHNGFKVGPNYQKPPAPVASEWIDSKSKGVNVAAIDLRDWWSAFNDPKLNALIEQAYQQNLTLRSAGTRILAARAQRNIAAGN